MWDKGDDKKEDGSEHKSKRLRSLLVADQYLLIVLSVYNNPTNGLQSVLPNPVNVFSLQYPVRESGPYG